MKCPYTIAESVQQNVNLYQYSETGNCTSHVHRLVEQHELMDCLKEECAAWQDGRCQYRGAVN